jgi:RNAse (barnase) inhibitor barstar
MDWKRLLAQPGGKAVLDGEGSPEAAEAAARQLGLFCVRIDGESVPGQAALLGRLARELHFPDYFGRNWDALQDCLTDLPDWLPAPGYVLVFTEAQALCRKKREDLQVLKGVFDSVAQFWREQKPPRPFKAVFFGSGDSV